MNLVALNISFALMVAVFVVYSILAYSRNDVTGKNLGRTIIFSTFVVIFYGIVFFFENELVISLCLSIVRSCIAWSLFFMARYVDAFVGIKVRQIWRASFTALFAIDTIVILTNPMNNFLAVYSIDIDDGYVSYSMQPQFFFYIHALLCFFAFAYSLARLINKAIYTGTQYRVRYLVEAGIFSVIMALEIWFIVDDKVMLDYSVFCYGLAAVVIYYFTYVFEPKRLMKNVQDIVDDSIADATAIYDEEGHKLRVNQALKAIIAKEDYENLETMKAFLGERKDGVISKEICGRVFEIRQKKVLDRHENVVATTFVFHDITENERQLEREHRIAITDALTGAYNRVGFFEEAERFMFNNPNTCFAIMVAGICDFKGINSLYGTNTGDALLLDITGKLRTYTSEFPMLFARTAEGKFAVLVSFEYVDRIGNELTRFEINYGEGAIATADVNFGFVVMDDMSRPLDYYYERALLALAVAKRNSNIFVMEYTKQMEESAARRQLMLSKMHTAIDNKEFFIVLQPQINLMTKKVCGAEALVRWMHPSLGLVSPGEFIPLFEDNGFITKIDTYVWEEAARAAVRMKEEGIYDGPVSVNVSQIDITSMNVPKIFEEIVKKTGIEKERLHIEITESACVDRRETLIHTMQELKNNGFKLEIDDFGSGYSSLNALMYLPFDTIKLDMAFMKADMTSERFDIIITSMAKMIHAMDAEIIVEGVETEENVERSIRFTGDVAQGYYFSKPLAVEDFCSFVKNNN